MSHRSAPGRRRPSLGTRPRILLSAATAVAVTIAGILVASPDGGSIVHMLPGSRNPPGQHAPSASAEPTAPDVAGPRGAPIKIMQVARGPKPDTDAAAAPSPALTAPDADIVFPLHTQGSSIVDASGSQVKLNLVNWYGADSADGVVGGLTFQPVGTIINQIVSMGFNGVRLPWSEQMWQANPVVSASLLSANKQFTGEHARTIFTTVVKDLAAAGLMVVLDNQASNAAGCCGSSANPLWYTSSYPQSQWLAEWKSMASAFRGVPQVIGADLRNEPHGTASWGGGTPATDWHAAAGLGGNAVLSADPQMLIFVEGTAAATDLSGAASLPVVLSVPGRVVYSVHVPVTAVTGYDQWAQKIQAGWGYLVGKFPLLVGAFGTCDSASSCVASPASASQGLWFAVAARYLAAHNLSWSYLAINGTTSDQDPEPTSRYGGADSHGLLNPTWSGPALPALLSAVQALQPACPAGMLANGTYYIRNVASHQVIDIPASNTAQGTDLEQWPLNKGRNQRWQVTRLSCDLYSVRSALDGESLDISAQSASPGAKIDQWGYWGGGNQQFLISQNAGGHYSITNINSTDPVAVPGSATAKGTLLQQSSPTGAVGQQWSFMPV